MNDFLKSISKWNYVVGTRATAKQSMSINYRIKSVDHRVCSGGSGGSGVKWPAAVVAASATANRRRTTASIEQLAKRAFAICFLPAREGHAELRNRTGCF